MKTQFTSRIVKLTFAFLFVLIAASCSQDDEAMDAAALANEINSEIAAKGAKVSTADTYTSVITGHGSVVCLDINATRTFTLSGWNGTAALNVQIYDTSILDWVSIDSFNGQLPSPQSLSYTFPTVGVYKLKYQVSGNSVNGGTNGFVEFDVTVVNCNTTAVGCSLSQGFWFASPQSVWTSVSVGGQTYTKAEGLAIWNSSNAGGMADSKKGFLQVAAIKLSGSTVLSTDSVWTDVAIVEAWLSTLDKLTPLNLNDFSDSNAAQAAGRIGDWINANHCE
ncbi:MAG: hypothetical protein Q8K04_00680 [Lutibacter sp.]|nr:hypothetical protein [Lutibacter sp.]